jgi:RNA polymerase-binding transcription factor
MALAESLDTDLPEGYSPSEGEPFMSPRQLEYFRRKLLQWKKEIVEGSRETISNLQKEASNHPDLTDRAATEADRTLELRARDRQRKLVSKIDAALSRIEDGTYGYCEATGEPIALARLEARPIATLTFEAQERHEQKERMGK